MAVSGAGPDSNSPLCVDSRPLRASLLGDIYTHDLRFLLSHCSLSLPSVLVGTNSDKNPWVGKPQSNLFILAFPILMTFPPRNSLLPWFSPCSTLFLESPSFSTWLSDVCAAQFSVLGPLLIGYTSGGEGAIPFFSRSYIFIVLLMTAKLLLPPPVFLPTSRPVHNCLLDILTWQWRAPCFSVGKVQKQHSGGGKDWIV